MPHLVSHEIFWERNHDYLSACDCRQTWIAQWERVHELSSSPHKSMIHAISCNSLQVRYTGMYMRPRKALCKFLNAIRALLFSDFCSLMACVRHEIMSIFVRTALIYDVEASQRQQCRRINVQPQPDCQFFQMFTTYVLGINNNSYWKVMQF